MFLKSYHFLVMFLCLMAVSLQSCLKDTCEGTNTFIEHIPIYKTLDEIRTNVTMEGSHEMVNTGKLYFYNDYIFINEIREGIHIIDNSDASNPQNIGFIRIPGNVDISVKDNTLFADNYIDLLSIDISNPQLPVLLNRAEDVFSSLSLDEDLGHLVYYEPTERTIEIPCSDPRWNNGFFFENGDVFFDANTNVPTANNVEGGATRTGIAGSLSRFALYDCFLYVIDRERFINVFDVKSTSSPELINTVEVSWGIETLFPYQDKLFIGSQSGLFIYDNSTPSEPTYISEFQHARACDPVFVKGNIAFVTLRDGTFCEGFINQLDVIDVSDILNPSLIESFPMDNPHGLSIKDNNLLLCEGTHGLKVFDIENVEDIPNNKIDHIKGFDAYDVISLPNRNVALVIGKDGLYQFDTSDPRNLKELSVLSVNR